MAADWISAPPRRLCERPGLVSAAREARKEQATGVMARARATGGEGKAQEAATGAAVGARELARGGAVMAWEPARARGGRARELARRGEVRARQLATGAEQSVRRLVGAQCPGKTSSFQTPETPSSRRPGRACAKPTVPTLLLFIKCNASTGVSTDPFLGCCTQPFDLQQVHCPWRRFGRAIITDEVLRTRTPDAGAITSCSVDATAGSASGSSDASVLGVAVKSHLVNPGRGSGPNLWNYPGVGPYLARRNP
jgi:hypothetical protein